MTADERGSTSILETSAFALLVVFAFVAPWRHAIQVVPGVTIGPPIVGLLTVVWVLAVLVRGRVRRPHAFHLAFGLFTVFAAASFRWTVDSSLTAGRVWILVYVFVLLVVAWDLLDSRDRIAIVAQALVIGVFLVGLVGIWELIQQGEMIRQEPIGHGVNANELARWVVLAAPLAAGLLTSSERFAGTAFGYVNVAYLVALPFMVMATGSRQGLVALGALILLGFVAVLHRWRSISLAGRHVVASVVVLGGFVLAMRAVGTLDGFLDRLPHLTRRLDTLGGRTPIWAEGVASIREHPLRGVGAGTYRTLTPPGMLGDPHNTFVGVAAELGLVGLAVFLVVVTIPVWVAIRGDGPSYVSAGILLAFGLFSIVAMLYNDPLNWLLLLLVLAWHSLPATHARSGNERLSTRNRPREADRVEPVPD